MNRVTLSALCLNNSDRLKNAVDNLASAFLDAQNDGVLPDLLIEARRGSPDYVGGLYVDLFEFCRKLDGLLGGSESKVITPIRDACQLVLAALAEGKPDSLILVNESADLSSHGISIYLPYLSDEQSAQVDKPMVKGGDLIRGGAKGFSVSDLLNSAAVGYRICARRDMISLTESYYPGLQLASETSKTASWYDFIAGLWPRILIKTAPADLNLRYSASQIAMNLFSYQPLGLIPPRATHVP